MSLTRCRILSCATSNDLLWCAEPIYGQNGELIDGGADLDLGGLCTYYHDLIYLAAFVQIASIFTSRAWWIFLLVGADQTAFSFRHVFLLSAWYVAACEDKSVLL